MIWWWEFAWKIICKKGRWVKRNRWGKGSKKWVTVESGAWVHGLCYIILSSFLSFWKLPLKTLKENFGLHHIYHPFYMALSSWLNYPKSRARSRIPLSEDNPAALDAGPLWAQRIYAFSSVGKSRKTMALWSLYSISSSRWFWAWGQGRFCPETVQILTPRDPGRAGTDRLQLGGQHSAADTRKMHSSVLLGLESYTYHILPCTMRAFLPKFLREK